MVTQLDLVCLLVEKGLASVSSTIDELGLARVSRPYVLLCCASVSHRVIKAPVRSSCRSTMLTDYRDGYLYNQPSHCLWSRSPLVLCVRALQTVVSTVSFDTPALLAFHHMAMDHKSAVGILDKEGKLVGSISVADLRDLPADQFGLLLKPISEVRMPYQVHHSFTSCIVLLCKPPQARSSLMLGWLSSSSSS